MSNSSIFILSKDYLVFLDAVCLLARLRVSLAVRLAAKGLTVIIILCYNNPNARAMRRFKDDRERPSSKQWNRNSLRRGIKLLYIVILQCLPMQCWLLRHSYPSYIQIMVAISIVVAVLVLILANIRDLCCQNEPSECIECLLMPYYQCFLMRWQCPQPNHSSVADIHPNAILNRFLW